MKYQQLFYLVWTVLTVQSAFEVTCSMREQLTIPEGKIDSLTSDSIQGCPSLEKDHELIKMADEGILENPNDPSWIKEQREDSTLKDCTTLTPE